MDDRHKGNRHDSTVDSRTAEAFQKLGGEFADAYISEFMLRHMAKILGQDAETLSDVGSAWGDPYLALRSFFGHYAFARRGKERDDLAASALQALSKTTKQLSIQGLLADPDGSSLWAAFVDSTGQQGKKTNEDQNRGVLQGMAELAQEIYREDGIGSIPGWVASHVSSTGQIARPFERIVDIRGVGPKCASMYLRDVVLACDVEGHLETAETIYIQPVDRWLRIAADLLVPEDGMDRAADWIVAGKIGKYARKCGASPLRFGMGVTYFGQRIVREPKRFAADLNAVLAGNLTAKASPRLF